jgi:putative FmdB family regulatory protein
MPIYAYKCESCGHRQDVLQKMSEPLLSVCPACGAPSFAKQLTAAGFQLKGSGWYATDFRGDKAPASAENTDGKPADTKPADAKPADAKAPAAAPSAAPAAPPAAKPSPPTSGAA